MYLPCLSEERLQHAYNFAEAAHAGQNRFSGEPYIIHPLGVAEILLDFHPDEDTLAAAFLHDVVEDTAHTLDEIETHFGPHVRSLCWGMVKLSKVRSKLNDPQIDNLRKLFLAMAKDFRVVLLKLCDRLHNMQTLNFVREDKQTRIAQETLHIYAPIAARLGIYRLKSQLEDLCFKHINPAVHGEIQHQLAKTCKMRDQYISDAKKILAETMSSEGIQCRVDGRVKSIYSIYRKMQKKNKSSIQEIFDIFAMRVILPDIYKYGKEYSGHLYTALGVLHNYFTPLANRFKDYIAVPKVNGYRSLHTTVMGLGPKVHSQPTEVQIRSESMHEYGEFGIAAHWMYEEDGGTGRASGKPHRLQTFEAAVANSAAPFVKQQKQWISGLGKIEKEIKSNNELMENLNVDVFNDRIFVLTPRGDVKDLPAGATPVDFAYEVHTEVGNRCIGAKVNGNIAPLDHELKNGEVVEILTRKNASPSQAWLGFVRTSHARNRVRAWFKNLDAAKHLRDGRALLNAKLEQLGKSVLDENLSLLKEIEGRKLPLSERQDLIKEIGRGALLPSAVLRKIFTMEELLIGQLIKDRPRGGKTVPVDDGKGAAEVLIGGEKGLPYQFVGCCDATPTDELVGYVTRGRGISIHKKGCSVLQNMKEGRCIPVHIAGQVPKYPVCIRIELEDRLGMIRDISQAIAANEINILDIVHGDRKDGCVEVDFIVEVLKLDQLERVLSDLANIPNIRRAFKANCGSS